MLLTPNLRILGEVMFAWLTDFSCNTHNIPSVTLVVIRALLAEKPIDDYKSLTRDIFMVHNSTRAIVTNKKETLKKHH